MLWSEVQQSSGISVLHELVSLELEGHGAWQLIFVPSFVCGGYLARLSGWHEISTVFEICDLQECGSLLLPSSRCLLLLQEKASITGRVLVECDILLSLTCRIWLRRRLNQ